LQFAQYPVDGCILDSKSKNSKADWRQSGI
jgi:hypothetical protein